MSFLKVNGVEVPVMAGGISAGTVEVGSPKRNFRGVLRSGRMRLCRAWKVTTPPLNHANAEALMGWLTWRGHLWSYDSSIFSARGLPAQAGSVGYLMHGTAADGAPVATHAKFGGSFTGGGLCTGPTATNLLASNQASPNATGIAAMTFATGMTGAYDATTCMIVGKTGTLKITNAGTDGSRSVATLSAVNVTAGTQYTFSAYVRSTGATSNVMLGLRWTGGVTTVDTGATVALSGTEWRRVSVTATAPVGTTQVQCQILEGTIDSTMTFWVDAMMLQAGHGNFAWVGGTLTRPTSQVIYNLPLEVVTAPAMTWMAWVGQPPYVTGVEYLPFALSHLTTGNRLELRSSADRRIYLASITPAFPGTAVNRFVWAVNTATGVAQWGSNPFAHLAVVMRRSGNYEIWWNGTLVGTGSSTNVPSGQTYDQLHVGTYTGTIPWCAPIDEMQFLPYAAGPAMIANLAASTTPLSAMPRFLCEGDFEPDAPVYCSISGVAAEKVGAVVTNGSWSKAAARVAFTMVEE